MKCIGCGVDVKYPERQDRKCPKCGQRFVFEPRTGDKLSDAAFKAAIERVSSQHSVKWTQDHLYYEVARRTRKGSKLVATICAVIGGGMALAALAEPGFLVFSAVLWTVAFFQWPRAKIGLERSDFESMWRRWQAVHGTPASLIVRKEEPKATAQKAKLPSDIGGYSFDRAVITDRPETADLLLANNFHFENNCAVLCVDGYPERAFETVRAMLRKNPKLTVYALHDVTLKGCCLAQRLAQSREWFKDRARVVDVGLRPAQAGPFKGCWLPVSLPLVANAALTAREQAFLSRYSLELAAIRPEQTIKRLFRAIVGQQQADFEADVDASGSSGGGDVYIDTDAFSDDAGASDGGGDSFG